MMKSPSAPELKDLPKAYAIGMGLVRLIGRNGYNVALIAETGLQ